MNTSGEKGFSIAELVLVVLVSMIVVAAGAPILQEAILDARAEAALANVTSALRQARQYAVSNRRIHRLRFIAPRTIKLERKEEGVDVWTSVTRKILPSNFEFQVDPQLPIAPNLTPDGLGANAAVDFGGSNEVFFWPDGSAVDQTGEFTNGIVYVSTGGEISSARAVTLLGATGRAKPWRFREEGQEWKWSD